MSFRVCALPMEPFAALFELSDRELRERRALLRVADRKPGFPCRVSLVDAEVGETVLLVNYEHQDAATPFRSSHAIYVRAGAVQVHCAVGEVPPLLRTRLISLRGFDTEGMLVGADAIEGTRIEEAIERLFEDERIAYLHLHYAKPGCYAARVERA